MDPEKTNFLNNLLNVFSSDMVAGAIEARLRWYLLDEEILGVVRAQAISVAGYDAAQQQVDIGMGMIGIFGTGHSGANPQAAAVTAFAQMIFSLAQWRGDPPFDPAFCDQALEVATGRVNPLQALQLLASEQDAALLGSLSWVFASDPVMVAVLGQAMRLLGVLAMPRLQLYDLYASLHQDRTEGDRIAAQLELSEAQVRASGDPQTAHDLAAMARDLAARTPEVDDDLQAIQLLIQLPSNVLGEPDVVESANQLLVMVRKGKFSVNIIPCIDAVRDMALRKRIEPQVLPQLAEAAERLLEAQLDHKSWMSLAESAVRLALRAGRIAEAEAILAQYRQNQNPKSTAEHRTSEILDAQVRWWRGEKEDAIASLERLYEQTPDPTSLPLLIVQMWPLGRPGLEKWVNILKENLFKGPLHLRIMMLFGMIDLTALNWGAEPVAALLEGLDLDRLRAEMSPDERISFDNDLKQFASGSSPSLFSWMQSKLASWMQRKIGGSKNSGSCGT